MSGDDVELRLFRAADAGELDTLLGAEPDPLWVRQGHRLHGEAREQPRWRRTLVAESDGRIVGAGTVAANRVHPGRYNLAVEVAPDARGGGIARALIDQLRALPPEPLPMAAKLRPHDRAALALLHAFGGRIYQSCPGVCPDPTSGAIRRWATQFSGNTAPLADVTQQTASELWAQQYEWIHEYWSPADPNAVRDLAGGVVAEADPQLSTITRRATSIEALVLVFLETDGTAAMTAETVHRHSTSGLADLGSAVARSLLAMAELGVAAVEIDGHEDDPHLRPLLTGLPARAARPLHLVEIPAAGLG